MSFCSQVLSEGRPVSRGFHMYVRFSKVLSNILLLVCSVLRGLFELVVIVVFWYYSTEHKEIEKITATKPQPHRAVLNYCAIFMIVVHNLEPDETPSNSVSQQAQNYAHRS